MSLRRIVKAFDDPYPGIGWTQANEDFGSFERDTRIRLGFSGGVFVCENTAPPAETQLNLYSQTAITASPQFFGASAATVASAIQDTYEWRITGFSGTTITSGATSGTWYDFNPSGLTSMQLSIDSPIFTSPVYRIQIREKLSGVTVANFRFVLDGYT